MAGRAQHVFENAVHLTGVEREAYLRGACGSDPSLRAEVDALFRAFQRGADSLGSPIAAATTERGPDATVVAPAREGPGTTIGAYKILQLIGEGGFGSVFMAEQERPVSRKVALKVIKLGMDTRAVIARFEAERQALALMEHPSIARVLDAGATDTGRPYFVMELVKGDPIVEYCDKNNLSIQDRLELFAQVCQAVQHAHTKGIIHRDIKPSNILVCTQDGRALAKVIDFGVAKATASKLTERTLFTEHRQLIGTPEYMSPEQAEGSLDIDTRTDIYSLGVLLYELLTGTTPFSSKELRSAAYAEVQRIIREVEPPKPSTRLSRNAETLAEIAAHRHTEPRKLGTIVRGELDWIVMKALEKDRGRRYETANGFAADIRRYLSGQAVLAAPPGAAYRARKFVSRHKFGVLAASVVAATLVLGLAGTMWQARAAAGQRDLARTETSRAVAAETEAKRRADDLKKVADFQGQMLAQVDPTTAGIRLAEDVRDRYTTALVKASVPEPERAGQIDAFVGQFSRVNATDAALKLIDQTILRPAADAIGKQFPDQPTVAATLRHALAERYHDLGMDQAAADLEQLALDARRTSLGPDHEDTLLSIGHLSIYLNSIGKRDEAEPLYRQVVEASRRVRGPENPETLTCIANLGEFLMGRGKPAEAEPLVLESLQARRRTLGDDSPDTLSSMSQHADLLREQGKFAEAEAQYRDVLARLRRVLGEDHLRTLSLLNDLGAILKYQGKLADAMAVFREVVDLRRRILGEMHPATLVAIQNLGSALSETGQKAEAEALTREALDKQRRLLGPDHFSTLVTMGNFCVFLINQDKFAEAEPLCRETLERRLRLLGENHPATLIANNVMGLVLIRQGRLAEGEPFWQNAQATAQRTLGPDHPETLIYTHNLAGLASDQKHLDRAEQLYRDVIRLGMAKAGPEHGPVLSAKRKLGALLNQRQVFAESEELLAAGEHAARKVNSGTNPHFLAQHLKELGTARAGLSRFAEAESTLLEAHQIAATARGETHQDTRDCARALADLYTRWDLSLTGQGYDAKAAAWRDKAAPTASATPK